MVWVDRELLERVQAALKAFETTAGHLALKNTREGTGYCNWRSESSLCVAHRTLVAELSAMLDRPRMRRPTRRSDPAPAIVLRRRRKPAPVAQLPLLEVVG